ncbi:MAG TPA: ATP-binding protein [Tepidisphaeraceae bacterium]|nr:ATP-binding protein [Tepidisphaeraceae bacterium]
MPGLWLVVSGSIPGMNTMAAGAMMKSTDPGNAIAELQRDSEAGFTQRSIERLLPSTLASVLAVTAAALFFIADVLLPRGAILAIGYTLVFVLASRSRKRMFLLIMAGVCIVLTWAGFYLEPIGAPPWISVFNRSMVTMVLLLTLALAWNRQPLIATIAERTKALRGAQEEIQSANEELLVVNQKMQRRNVELSQLNDDLSNLLTGVGLPIVMLCKDLQIRRFTPAAADALHLVPEDVGRPIGKVNCTCGVRDLEKMVLDAVASNTPIEREIQDSTGRWQLQRVRPYRTADNKVAGAVLLMFDVDDRKRAAVAMRMARDLAEEANRDKDVFLALLSHELRTPLSAILGWAHLLRSEKLDPAKALEAADAIETSGRAQAALINDLLDVSRIVAGKMELDTRPLDLASVVNAASQAARPHATAKQIRLEQSVEAPLPPILGDPRRLQQVASNLLSNAIKFTPSGGQVDVVLRSAGSWVELVVRDTGVGISANFLPHVFDRFQQEQTTATRRGGGLGLGMAIVRNLVELHGGTVGVDSDGRGKGATFIVRLPVAAILPPPADQPPQQTTSDDQPPSESHDLSGLRIHLVDDAALGRGMIATLLRNNGATVTESGTVADALKMMNPTPPDVLISYIGMPGEDGGYGLIREVRRLDAARGHQTPAVALTAYTSPQDRRLVLAAGFNTHVPKPVDPAELVEVVAHLAGRA